MSVQYEIINKCLIIRLSKELDHHEALSIREKSDKIIDRNNIKNVIFDFTNTAFMDSAGIGLLLGRYKKVIFNGGKVGVSNVSKDIERIFEISGLYKIIEKYETAEYALESTLK